MLSLLRRKKAIRKSREGKLVSVLNAAGVDLVLDVGANVGQTHDELRAAGFHGHIVSFEPTPAAHATLVKRQDSDRKWVVAPRMALGEHTGVVEMRVSEASDMSSILPSTESLDRALPKTRVVEKVETPVARLDDVVQDYRKLGSRPFLKIDTQGYERKVLKGAEKTLNEVCGVEIELSLFPLYEGEETYLSFLQDFHAWGFTPFMLTERTFSRSLGRQLQIDAVFMRAERARCP